MLSFILFILVLAVLIAFHEYGHFIVARLCGVKVLRFSIGFGKPLLKWINKQGTEVVIAWIPLGGYVKMLDEREDDVSIEERPFAFNRQSLAKRTAIVAAGPVFNLIFAIFLYWIVFTMGIVSVMPVIGEVKPDSLAAHAGLQAKHAIVSIDKQATPNWRSVSLRLIDRLGQRNVPLQLQSLPDKKTSEHVIHLDEMELNKWQPNPLESIGLKPFIPELPAIIDKVIATSPADAAQLKSGDHIVSINHEPMPHWQVIGEYIQAHPNTEIKLGILRGSDRLVRTVLLGDQSSPAGEKQGYLGVQIQSKEWPKAYLYTQKSPFYSAWWPAIKTTVHHTVLTFSFLWKMLMGDLSPHQMTGPVGLAVSANQLFSHGINYYLEFIAVISIGLAVINILPIPILDGGHLLYYFIEWVRGKPLSQKMEQLGLRIGLSILIGLVTLAVFNDLVRLFTL